MKLNETFEKLETKSIQIEVFGLGYVGFPLAVRLASGGFNVLGIDVNHERISRLEKNDLNETELNLKNEFLHIKKEKLIKFSDKPSQSDHPKIAFICVHTPIASENIESDTYVKNAIEKFLQTSKKGDIVVIESSIGGGTTEKMQTMIEDFGYDVGSDFGLCFCPERIDPQNKKWNLENIPRIIYCSDDVTFKITQKLYNPVNHSNLHRVSSAKIAEVVKSYENAFRLVNISLVNELGILCEKLKIDVNEVINAAKTKPFGFMPFYPGAGAGGHCIPKDPRFLLDAAKKNNLEFSSIENALRINAHIPKHICQNIEEYLESHSIEKSVLVCGLSYKPDVGDMRDSSGFKILNELTARGFKVGGYDPYFNPQLIEKYLIENFLDNLEFKNIKKLTDENISKYSCICLVQNHSIDNFVINDIYEKSKIKMIYDCVGKIKFKNNSNTVLKTFGKTSISSK
jgi:UDP-N-acetyl-D-glucosamine dehydrogenase